MNSDESLLSLAGRRAELPGGLPISRLLPDAKKRSVGPFVFFDHMGPADLPAGTDSDVGGHPHIGLATVTYLYEGSLLHRDSLGTIQRIEPGAVNWMTAGRGIVHSERTPDEQRNQPRRLHGLQLWVALPPALETVEPAFQHVAAEDIPELDLPGNVQLRVLAGTACGATSPIRAASETLYLDLCLPPGATWELPPLAEEMAIYSAFEDCTVNGQKIEKTNMAVLPPGQPTRLDAGPRGLRLAVIGGVPLERPVRMWWNFVSSERPRLAEAARRWSSGGFPPIPGETDRIPAPDWVD